MISKKKKIPNLVRVNVRINVRILVSQKVRCCNLVFAFLLTHRSERRKPLVAVMHQPAFTLREGLRRQGRSDGGDIKMGHPVFSVSCLGFLLEGAGLCVYHRTVLSVTDALLQFVVILIGQITLNSHSLTLTQWATCVENVQVGWMDGWINGSAVGVDNFKAQLFDTLEVRGLKNQ